MLEMILYIVLCTFLIKFTVKITILYKAVFDLLGRYRCHDKSCVRGISHIRKNGITFAEQEKEALKKLPSNAFYQRAL